MELSAANGFVNLRVTDRAWLAARRPPPEERVVPAAPPAPSFQFTALGCIDSCFPEKHGCPRQGAKVPTSRARLTLRDDISSHVFDGLADFSHVWLIFVFHGNDGVAPLPTAPSAAPAASAAAPDSAGAPLAAAALMGRSKMCPPRLGGAKTGMLASRTPHRVNPIGLTVCRLDRVAGSTLHLSGVDLIDGTPILDIKPYHPADVVPESDQRHPDWVAGPAHLQMPALTVTFSARALQQLADAVASGQLQFYAAHEGELLKQAIVDCLALDPRSTHSKTKHEDGGIYALCIDALDVVFRTEGQTAHCWKIEQSPPGAVRVRTRNRPWHERLAAEWAALDSAARE